jgi:hypothetical protein
LELGRLFKLSGRSEESRGGDGYQSEIMNDRLYSFIGGAAGAWHVSSVDAVIGESLPAASRLLIQNGHAQAHPNTSWILQGVTSNERYVTRIEKERLAALQPPLGRPEATCAALIPIRKSAEWWAMPQDERRAVFEESSHHLAIGSEYLPAVARRLHHCRDLDEPFDFLTWFEYAPRDAASFEHLVARLRQSPEWRYVEREVDIRVQRAGAA